MTQISQDSAVNIRAGEELDLGKLNDYLSQNLIDFDPIVEVQQFPGGFSNLTYLLKTNTIEYVLRRAPNGANIKSAHDMCREYKVLTTLKPFYKTIPNTIILCEDPQIIGASFYLMEKVNGVILRGNRANKYKIEPDKLKTLSENLVDNLADLHKIDIVTTGLDQLGKPDGYVDRQVNGWIERYSKSKTDDIAAMEKIATWLVSNKPRAQKSCFIHNDYKYDNMVFDNDLENIIAVLDWEMATVGDPLMDLGAMLAYWCEANDGEFLKTMNLTWLEGNLTRKEIVARYAAVTGIDVSDIVFYYVFGLYKNTVIIQQIYARWKLGLTKDPRFQFLIVGVNELSKMAESAIENNSF